MPAGWFLSGLPEQASRPGAGWLQEVAAQVSRAAGEHLLVPVEATGAWDSDWMLAGQPAQRAARTPALTVPPTHAHG